MTQQDIEEGKTTAIVSYLSIIGSVIAIFMNIEKKNPYASFHSRQGLGLWLTFSLLGLVTSNFDSWVMSTAFYIFFTVLFVYGFTNAIGGKAIEVPLLGGLYQKIFANLGK